MRLSTLAAGTVGLGLGVAAYASLVERNWYRLRRVVVPMLPPGSMPLRILHLSDLHMTPGQARKQRWVAALASLGPDLVIVTGDNMASTLAVPAVLRSFEPLFDFP